MQSRFIVVATILSIAAGCATPTPDQPVSQPSSQADSAWVVFRDNARLDSTDQQASIVWRCMGDSYEIVLVDQIELADPVMVRTRFATDLDTAPAESWERLESPGTVLRAPASGDALDRWTRSARARRSIDSTDDTITLTLTDANGMTRTHEFVTHGITEAHEQLSCRPALPRR